MRRTIWIHSLVPLMLVAALAWAAPKPSTSVAKTTSSRKAAKDEWPSTPTGLLARRWAEAFSKGEKAIKEALPEILAPENLAKRTMEDRMESYRGLHDRFGALMLVKIESATPDSLVATLASSDMSQRQFVFAFQSAAPYKVTRVTIREYQSHGHSGGFHH